MKTLTKSFVTHRTALTADPKLPDGGRALLIEGFDFIRSTRSVGKLVAQFGIGGSISSLVFEETDSIAQKDIEIAQ